MKYQVTVQLTEEEAEALRVAGPEALRLIFLDNLGRRIEEQALAQAFRELGDPGTPEPKGLLTEMGDA